MIETDHHVGRVLELLDEKDLTKDTLVIFTSDNGPETTWRKRIKRFGHRSNYIYREGKRSEYEGGHRVPFFVRWPAGIRDPGRSYDGTVCQTDVLATLAELVGDELEATAGEDSQSFLSTFESNQAVSRVPTIHHSINGRFAVRDGKWKLVMPHGKKGYELYDLQADQSEKNDVLNEHPKVVAKLKRVISDIVIQGRSTSGSKQRNDTGYWEDLTWITADEYSQN